jgi:hypothetical protein
MRILNKQQNVKLYPNKFMKTTNYYNTFIDIAEDCSVTSSEIPPLKGDNRTTANIQFDLISKNPYKYTSDDILFRVYAIKHNIPKENLDSERGKFFSKGQPCFRSSPLTKRYGWGVHSDSEGRIALVALGTAEYQKLKNNKKLKVLKAMRTKKGGIY